MNSTKPYGPIRAAAWLIGWLLFVILMFTPINWIVLIAVGVFWSIKGVVRAMMRADELPYPGTEDT